MQIEVTERSWCPCKIDMPIKKKPQVVNAEIPPTMLNKLKELRKSVGLRQFESGEDRSYAQWEAEAENLIIRIFDSKSNQYDQFQTITDWYKDEEPKKEPRQPR